MTLLKLGSHLLTYDLRTHAGAIAPITYTAALVTVCGRKEDNR